MPAAQAKASDQTTATVGASRLVRCQRRSGLGASIRRPAVIDLSTMNRVCGLERVCGTGLILEAPRVMKFQRSGAAANKHADSQTPREFFEMRQAGSLAWNRDVSEAAG